MKKSTRIAITAAVLVSLAPLALAASAPGGTVPQPMVVSFTLSTIIAAILSFFGL